MFLHIFLAGRRGHCLFPLHFHFFGQGESFSYDKIILHNLSLKVQAQIKICPHSTPPQDFFSAPSWVMWPIFFFFVKEIHTATSNKMKKKEKTQQRCFWGDNNVTDQLRKQQANGKHASTLLYESYESCIYKLYMNFSLWSCFGFCHFRSVAAYFWLLVFS